MKYFNESQRLMRSLNKVCDSKMINSDTSGTSDFFNQKFYAYNPDKFLKFLCDKYFKIYSTLSKRYESSESLPKNEKRKIL